MNSVIIPLKNISGIDQEYNSQQNAYFSKIKGLIVKFSDVAKRFAIS